MTKRAMRWPLLILGLWCITMASPARAQQTALPTTPRAGGKIPPFQARDQFGRNQTLDSLTGPQGLVLLFFRSADW